jgi:uracil-DNA glycosylase
MSDLRQIVDETIQALEEMKRAGVTHIEVSQGTLEALGKPAGERVPPAPRAVAPPPAPPTGEMAAIERRAQTCTKCSELSRCRHSVVFGIGNSRAELMFIGEAPGADEDAQGKPFVGRAGQLLTKIIEAMGLTRDEVYITNVLKCRPPQNRTPLPDEVTNCLPYLLEQIELIQPKVIVALGAVALRALLDVHLGITKMRGNWYTYRDIPIMPTFHPAYLLRNPPAKKEVWDDMRAVVKKLGRALPARQ